MKIGITDYIPAPFTIERDVFDGVADIVFLDAIDDEDFDLTQLADLDALLVWHAHISERTATALSNCKIVVRYGVGYDNIDVGGLERNNIVFCNTPDYGTEEVADTAVAMALSLSRAVLAYDVLAKSLPGDWQENTIGGIKRLAHSTVGIIGVGRIGSSVLRRFRPFGPRLIGYDPFLTSGHEKALGYERANTLEDLLAESDIVSLHCPLSPETQGLVDTGFLATMKKGAILVNTARGGLIESTDILHAALNDGTLGGVGLDVLPQEPPQEDSLIKAWRSGEAAIAGRVIINPHTAYFSEQAWTEMRQKTAETALHYLQSGHIRNRITM